MCAVVIVSKALNKFVFLQVHPYSKMAWQIVSSLYHVSWQRNSSLDISSPCVQVVRNQISTDQKLIDLVATMEHIYSFVDVIQSNVSDKVDVLAETIKRIFT